MSENRTFQSNRDVIREKYGRIVEISHSKSGNKFCIRVCISVILFKIAEEDHIFVFSGDRIWTVPLVNLDGTWKLHLISLNDEIQTVTDPIYVQSRILTNDYAWCDTHFPLILINAGEQLGPKLPEKAFLEKLSKS